mmetsp:Transcript_12475/g.38798  ORF Transcript_12475/g.38798 Transcript_12475/m.38798 type:complete len:246 (-) Transcript_12475:1207-1944(-)
MHARPVVPEPTTTMRALICVFSSLSSFPVMKCSTMSAPGSGPLSSAPSSCPVSGNSGTRRGGARMSSETSGWYTSLSALAGYSSMLPRQKRSTSRRKKRRRQRNAGFTYRCLTTRPGTVSRWYVSGASSGSAAMSLALKFVSPSGSKWTNWARSKLARRAYISSTVHRFTTATPMTASRHVSTRDCIACGSIAAGSTGPTGTVCVKAIDVASAWSCDSSDCAVIILATDASCDGSTRAAATGSSA